MSMTHEQAIEELAGVALDAVPSSIAEQVRAHAAACDECARELAGLEDTVSEMAALVPGKSMNPGRAAGIRSRLLSRAAVDRENRGRSVGREGDTVHRPRVMVTPPAAKRVTRDVPVVAEHEPGIRPRRPLSAWVAMAATVALVATGAQLLRVTQERDALRATADAGDREISDEETQKLQASLAAKDEIIAGLTGPDVRIIPLTNRGAKGPLARMFWDRKSDGWTLVTYNMRQPRESRTFQAWLVTRDGKKISAGTFTPDPQGNALVRATYKLERDALQAVAVTEEPAGGVAAPTGPVIIAGSPG